MRFITVIIILFISFPLYAGPYINIKSIDACSDYPKIMISTQIKGASKSDITLIDWKNISVYEDGSVVKNKIEVVKENPDENFLYLVLSIDSSKSISSKDLTKIKISAVDIVRSIGPKDKIAIYHFNDDVMQLHDFSRDINNIEKSINAIKRHGKKTLLYNSIHESLMLFEKVNQTNKKIIVFTDGKDEEAVSTTMTLFNWPGLLIYRLFYLFKDSNNIRIMARISKLTGRKLIYSKDHEDISGMYDTILSVMKNSYNVYYTTDLKRDGIHELEISIKLGSPKDSDTKRYRCQLRALLIIFV